MAVYLASTYIPNRYINTVLPLRSIIARYVNMPARIVLDACCFFVRKKPSAGSVSSGTAFSGHVGHVVFVRSKKKMVGVNTLGVVAAVQNKHVPDGAIPVFVGPSVCCPSCSCPGDFSGRAVASVVSTDPNPAGVGYHDA